MGSEKLRIEGEGLTIGGDGLVQLAGVFQDITEVVVGLGIVGFQGDGLAIGHDGLVRLPVASQGHAEIAVGLGIIGSESDGPADQFHGNLPVSNLMGEKPQIMQGIGMVRLLGQDLPIKRLGLLQAVGCVVLKCHIEGLLDCLLSHEQRRLYSRSGLKTHKGSPRRENGAAR